MSDKNFRHPLSNKSRKTRARIMKTYVEFMSDTDFDQIRVSDVIRTLDIARGTFYTYFADIYDVIEHIEDELLENMPSPNDHFSPPLYELGGGYILASGARKKQLVPPLDRVRRGEFEDVRDAHRPPRKPAISPQA